jgi:hypothetical protein
LIHEASDPEKEEDDTKKGYIEDENQDDAAFNEVYPKDSPYTQDDREGGGSSGGGSGSRSTIARCLIAMVMIQSYLLLIIFLLI